MKTIMLIQHNQENVPLSPGPLTCERVGSGNETKSMRVAATNYYTKFHGLKFTVGTHSQANILTRVKCAQYITVLI